MAFETQAIPVTVSVPNASSAQSGKMNTSHARRLRWFLLTSGADCTVTAQTSYDGTTWFTAAAAYTLAATGLQAIIDFPGPFARINVGNVGAGVEVVTAALLIEPLS